MAKSKINLSRYTGAYNKAFQKAAYAASYAIANQAVRRASKKLGSKRPFRGLPTKTKRPKKKRKYKTVRANVAGTTHTTSRMIVRKTPAEQRFIRQLFKNNPHLVKHVNRFGFAWMGAKRASKTIWYSVTHLKFNNVMEYMKERIILPTQSVGQESVVTTTTQNIGNAPQTTIYIGKCTYNYEIYNPTNYIMTVYIYDLICKKDTPSSIFYGDDQTTTTSSSPEICMQQGSVGWSGVSSGMYIGDQTNEDANSTWQTIGIKPTDYHSFNVMWKVKGMKKIILPPASSHHHVVVYNPKKKITLGGLCYPHLKWNSEFKNGLGGLTQSTLFGFEGQIAVEDNQTTDVSGDKIGTLPGKLIVKCIRKQNVYNFPMNAELINQENSLRTTEFEKPTIFTDVTEHEAGAT